MSSRLPRLRRLAPRLLLAVLAGCVGASTLRPPAVAPTRTLALGAEDPRPGAPRPFAVVFGGPRGATIDPTEVTVVFNRPMRPLELVGDESAPPAAIRSAASTVPPRGRWLWMGTSALVFVPDPPLPRATEFTVTVATGTRALDGSTLAAPYSFTFSTPRPRLVRAEPKRQDPIRSDQTFELRFNQPVDPSAVQRAATLMAGADTGTRIAVRASRPKDGVPGLVKLTPATPLPLDSTVTLALDGSLRGTEGLLTLGETRRIAWRTYAPLRVVAAKCQHDEKKDESACYPGSPITLVLSNPVKVGDVLAHARVDALAPKTWGTRNDDGADNEADEGPNGDVGSSDDSLVSEVELPGGMPPDSRHVVTVRAGLTDQYGQKLAHDATFTLVTKPNPPTMELGISGQTLEAVHGVPGHLAPAQVPVYSVNQPTFDVMTAPVDEREATALLWTRHLEDSPERWQHFRARAFSLAGAHLRTVHPAARPNVETAYGITLADLLGGPQATGTRVLGLKEGDPVEATLLSVTDLAVTAKLSRFGDVFWVTRLSSGAPVGHATVTLRSGLGRDLGTTTTDVEGIATLPDDPGANSDRWQEDPRVVFVRAGEDWTFHALWEERGSATAGSPWAVVPDGGLHAEGEIFTERGVYQPGETVRVKGFFRMPLARGTSTPAGAQVEVNAVTGTGHVLFRGPATLDRYGGFAVDVGIPRQESRTGVTVAATLGGDEATAAQTWARIADFEPAEFSVDVATGDLQSYVRGDAAPFTVHGDYLFGAPMSGAKVRWRATREDASFQPPDTGGLVCDDEAFAWSSERAASDSVLARGTGALDARGVYTGTVALALPKQARSALVSVEAEVEDTSRQAVASRAAFYVHPGDFYVALQAPDEPFVPRGATLHPRVAAVDPTGKRRPGVHVHVDLLRRTWNTRGDAITKSLGGCDATTTGGPALAGCDLVVAEYGDYVVRATARDGHENELAASFEAYALGGPASSEKVELTLDKKQYEVGDVARVAVRSPWPEADALVTIERTGVYRQERVALHGASTLLRVPVTEDLWPNADVVVHVVRGRSGDAPLRGGYDAGRPDFRVGWAALSIDRRSHDLRVVVAPDRRDHHPGDEMDVDVTVTGRDGKPSPGEVTLWAVDEGVLMLTDYATPDPAPAFASDRPLAVLGVDSRTDLARIHSHLVGLGMLHGTGHGYGYGSGGMGETSTRADFRPTVFFEPSIVTGPDGRAHHRFKLPDGLTTYRIMAVAATSADRFGSGDSKVVTSQPLMVRASLPRFLRAGDTVDAGVLLTGKGLAQVTADVTVEATGVTVTGPPTRGEIALPPGGTVEVTWPFAAPVSGPATFTFTARAGAAVDRVKVTRDVSLPMTMEAVALSGETTTAAAEQLGDLGAMRRDAGGLDLRLASTALVGLGGGVDQLLTYPYGCTEQLASRLVPLTALRGLARDFDLPLPADVDGVLADTVAKIEHNQLPDGSFGYWPESRKGDTWLTAYALWALTLAHAGGGSVATHAIAALKAYLADDEKRTGVELSTKAFVVDVLAQAGDADVARMRALFDAREKLPLFARALLAHAMMARKIDEAHARELLRDADNHLRVTATGATVAEALGDEYAPLLDSEARTTAIVLYALLAADRASPLAPRLARGLLDVRRGGTWRSTQETAWALLALDAYRAVQEAAPPDFDALVFHGDDLLASAPFHGRTTREVAVSLPATRLLGGAQAPFTFSVRGTGTLFYEARLRYARRALPDESVDRGFTVRKVLRPVSAEGLGEAVRSLSLTGATSVTAGQLVLVDLFVTTPDPRENVVVDDPVPAGLQPAQTSLATTADWLDVGPDGDRADAEANEDDDERASGRTPQDAWYRREVRDDRVLTFVDHMPAGFYHYRYVARAVTPGRYGVPPTQAECMYQPETFGRTAATSFEVVAR